MKSLWVFTLSFLVLLACDRVPYNEVHDRPVPVIPVDTVIPIDTTTNPGDTTNNPVDTTAKPDTVTYVAVTSFKQKVLIEDFTGHTCGNCPEAAKEAKRLEAAYAGKVVVMAVHCSFFADPKTNPSGPFTMDFRTAAGTALDDKFKVSTAGLPKGLINRGRFSTSSTSILSHTEWEPKLNLALSQSSSNVGLSLNPKYDATTKRLTLYNTVKVQNGFSGQLRMAAYVVEDSITAWQKDYSLPSGQQNVANYVHMHALRSELGPSNGVAFVSTAATIPAGASFKSTWVGVLSNVTRPAQAKVIVIVTRTDTDEIVQVEEAHLLN